MSNEPSESIETPIWEVFVPVAVSYAIADHEALDAATTAELVDGEGDFEASPFMFSDSEANVWGPWQPEPDEDIDDSYAWQRDSDLNVRALADVRRAFAALNGLIRIYTNHELGLGRAAPTSAADQCNDLYALLGSIELPVP